jgi:hypothetical protein
MLKWILALFILSLSSFYAYRTGTRLAGIEIERLQGEVAAASANLASLQEQGAAQRQELRAARSLAARWRRAYERDVPTGKAKTLYDAVVEKLDAGLSRERLAFVIAAADDGRDCDEAAPNKRFLVTTSLQRASRNTAVSFLRGTIVVTAAGASAIDARGNAEAWFDPAQPVKVSVVALSGESSEEEGLLPLYPSLVVGNVEHRFSVVAGPQRGFVQTSMQNCRYP